jgi:thiol-disulfide isomerase/thioredoxin
VKLYRSIIFIALLTVLFQTGFCQLFDNPDQAFLAASQDNRPVLLIFSGSDWCLPCERLNREIISDSSFKNFANQRLILVEADFPQRTKLSKEQSVWNEKLAEEFNPEGIFPYLLLLKPDKTVITSLEYIHYDATHFIEQINNALTMSGK